MHQWQRWCLQVSTPSSQVFLCSFSSDLTIKNLSSLWTTSLCSPDSVLRRSPCSSEPLTRQAQRASVHPFSSSLLPPPSLVQQFCLLKGKCQMERGKFIGVTFLKKCYPWGGCSLSSTKGQDEVTCSSTNHRRDGKFFPAWVLEPGSSGLSRSQKLHNQPDWF